MADRRSSPFLTASWLSKVLSGDAACHWSIWFQAHHKLTEKRPDDFDAISWQIDHTRMLTELIQGFTARGLKVQKEVALAIDLPAHCTKVKCKSDCLVFEGSAVTVYDCKTGRRRPGDSVQVMIYMHALSLNPRFQGLTSRGAVVYKDGQVDIPSLPHSFPSDLAYFVGLLTADSPPLKAPGDDCRFCNITRTDCPEREAQSGCRNG